MARRRVIVPAPDGVGQPTDQPENAPPPPRRSERIREQKKPPQEGSNNQPSASNSGNATVPAPAPPSATPPSSSDRPRRDSFVNRDLDYHPHYVQFPTRIGRVNILTVRQNIDVSTSRPPRDPLIKISPLGDRCVVTFISNGNGTVHDVHHVARSACISLIRALEKIMGLPPGTLNLDSRYNRVLLEMAIHHAYDNGLCAFFPTLEDLSRLYRALKRERIMSADGKHKMRSPKDGKFYHHLKVFPRAIREFQLIPFLQWGSDVPITCKRTPEGNDFLPSFPPFVGADGEELLRPVWSHCDPILVVAHAWEALEAGASVPAYAEESAILVRKIGDIIAAEMSDD